MGPGLGGGFGRLLGLFGLILDNIIDMEVVIADGSLINVSASSHPDLYWAMRGAGHNYGIVTSFNFKIYDEPAVNWYFNILIFTADKLEAVFKEANILGADGKQPKEITTYFIFAINPEISTTEVCSSHLITAWGMEVIAHLGVRAISQSPAMVSIPPLVNLIDRLLIPYSP